MPTCEDCHAPGAQLGQGDRNLCKRCSDKRSPPVDSPQGQGEPNKIFINDLLCFVVNKMDKMPGDIVTKLCLETYSEEEIEDAKKLTFDTCKPSERFRKRQGTNKSVTNMSDILRVLHSADPLTLPTFASASLRLPVVELEHTDFSLCFQEIQVIRQEMKVIRATTVDNVKVQAEIAALRREIAELKDVRASAPQTAPAPRHTTFADVVSENHPQSIVHPPAARRASGPTQVHVLRQGAATKPKSLAPMDPAQASRSSPLSPRGHSSGVPTAPDEDGFNMVKRKKNKSRAVVGTAKSSTLSAIKARPVEIFVTRLGPDTKSEDVERAKP
ncbi:PREDICTED: uncharacterized protein LOC109483976 [Branchiostoma belcheri]|uniref:Uncharacterized protein LOC109483976 n=1 Tax=Branchiostoma belcheri TaxID=7741 RepID=A0A6P5A0C9_BRABE|nr:PREDICTED: uncharacterized protein LOC109483976 [Branchiostoma belcheri]